MNCFIKKHQNAFTLAEVLITLGIIGIVAVILIPQITKNAQEYAWKQAWKKEYSTLSKAYNQIKQDEGGDLSAYFSTVTLRAPAPLAIKFRDYLSVIQICGTFTGDDNKICGTDSKTLPEAYKALSGAYLHHYEFNSGQYILKDGAHVYFRTYNAVNYFIIWVDVNGYGKGPNMAGKDLFGIVVSKDKIMPMGANGTGVENTCKTSGVGACPSTYGFSIGNSLSCAGAGCSAEYLYK